MYAWSTHPLGSHQKEHNNMLKGFELRGVREMASRTLGPTVTVAIFDTMLDRPDEL